MKWLLFMFLIPIVSYSQNNDSLITINGKVWYSEQYCMGTPPEEDDLYKSHGYAGIKLYLVKKVPGKLIGELILNFISDNDGNFSFTIPKGEYYICNTYPNIYEYQLVYPQNPESIEWMEWPAYEFNTQQVSYIELSFGKRCPPGPDRM